MQRNEDQEKRCFDLLRRIGALQLDQVYAYAQDQVNEFSSKNKAPVPNIAEELDNTRLILSGVLRDVPAVDGDETESSSEDESCEELEIGTKRVENYLPIGESPGATWAQDRGNIISSWTWLQDAIAHVNFQMTQHEELYKHFRATKIPVTVDDKFSSPARVSAASSLIDAQIQIYKAGPESEQQNTIMSSNSLSSSMMRKSPSHSISFDNFLPMGYAQQGPSSALKQQQVDQPRSTSSNDSAADPNRYGIGGGLEPLALQLRLSQQNDPTCVARRCLPTKQLRPRKIYRVRNLTVADSEDHSCDCDPSQVCSSCYIVNDGAFCTRKIPLSLKDAAASLDSSYHRNLSFPDDIPVSLLLDTSLKMEGWKHNKPKGSTFRKIPLQSIGGYQRLTKSAGLNAAEQKRRGRPKLQRKSEEGAPVDNKLAALAPASEQKQEKAAGGKKNTRRASSGDCNAPKKAAIKRRKYNSVSAATKKKRQSVEDADQRREHAKPATRAQARPGRPRLTEAVKAVRRRRAPTDDINNIVIPYSIAAATRIEKIEYKEILTPGFRATSWYMPLLQKRFTPGETGERNEDIDEDTSDENYIAMHAKCEVEERRRFFLASMPLNRRSRRTDSKTETIDPISAPESPKVSDTMPPSPNVGPQNPQIVTASAATMAATAVKVAPGKKRRLSKKEMQMQAEVEEPLEYGYEPRRFPISGHEYARMCAEMPDGFFDDSTKKKDQVNVPPQPQATFSGGNTAKLTKQDGRKGRKKSIK